MKEKKQRQTKRVRNGNGKVGRTALQKARQERVFRMSVLEGYTYREIAKELHISTNVVVSDIRAEEARRAEELGARRESEKARAVAIYEDIHRRAIRKSDTYDRIIDTALDKADKDARKDDDDDQEIGDGIKFKKPDYQQAVRVTDHSLESAIQARARIDKILGLEAPVKIDAGLDAFLEALQKKLDDDDNGKAAAGG